MLRMDFSHLVNILSGLLIVVFASYKAFITIFGNTKYFKEKKEKKKQEEKEERALEREEAFDVFTKKVITPMIQELKSENDFQNKRMEQLIQSSNDMMRYEITKIYYKYHPYKKIPIFVKESLTHLYNNYSAQNGNTFIQGIVKEMDNWTITNTDEEAKQKSI